MNRFTVEESKNGWIISYQKNWRCCYEEDKWVASTFEEVCSILNMLNEE